MKAYIRFPVPMMPQLIAPIANGAKLEHYNAVMVLEHSALFGK